MVYLRLLAVDLAQLMLYPSNPRSLCSLYTNQMFSEPDIYCPSIVPSCVRIVLNDHTWVNIRDIKTIILTSNTTHLGYVGLHDLESAPGFNHGSLLISTGAFCLKNTECTGQVCVCLCVCAIFQGVGGGPRVKFFYSPYPWFQKWPSFSIVFFS